MRLCVAGMKKSLTTLQVLVGLQCLKNEPTKITLCMLKLCVNTHNDTNQGCHKWMALTQTVMKDELKKLAS